MYKIPISKPFLTQQDFLEIKKCFDSTWIYSKSPWVAKFEKKFAKKVSRTKYAISVNSGTSALFLALLALGVGPGDEVIMPSLTMIATINAVQLTGARTVLVDSVSKDDWNIDPAKIEQKINKRTKVIMPVHLYGYPCDMDRINALAKKHNLFVIEDAAEAMGSLYKGNRAGSLSDIACFSLYSNKIITTANGGMACTDNKKLYDLINKLKFFDYNSRAHFKHKLIGYNLVLSGLQAALGYSQIGSFGMRLKKRRRVFSWYKQELKDDGVKFIDSPKKDNPNYWFPAIIAKKQPVKRVIEKALSKHRIEFREFFLPVHRQPVYKKLFSGEKYPIADYFFERGLLLPSHFDLSLKEVKYICKVIKSALKLAS